ncbi:MAG: transporter substrate-binding domain-containing protein, partial [Planctomycetes bacterium]|nr:transporter substrate-binding domain-containing protein [Planctomycetota bacterium]
MVLEGDAAPGTLDNFSTLNSSLIDAPLIDSFGNVLFEAFLTGSAAVNNAIYRTSGTNKILFAREGGSAPLMGGGTDGTYSTFDELVGNVFSSQFLFTSTLAGTLGGAGVDDFLLQDHGNASARTGGTGLITIQNTGLLDINSDGTFNANSNVVVRFGATLLLNGGAVNANAGLDASDGTLDFRDGTLTVTGGAFLPNAGGATDDYLIDGPSAIEFPHLTIGAGATANIGRDLFVGDVNRGELTVSGGGDVSNRFGYIGNFFGSTGVATVDGVGSTWTNNIGVLVGFRGDGTLNIQNGGTVFSLGDLGLGDSIGGTENSTGTATVDGPGSSWINSVELEVGVLILPPYVSEAVSGEIEGLYPDLVREALAQMGHVPKFFPVSFARGLRMLETGDLDAFMSVFKTPEREIFAIFPDEPLSIKVIALFAKSDLVDKFN